MKLTFPQGLSVVFILSLLLVLGPAACSPKESKSEAELLKELKDRRIEADERTLKNSYDRFRLPEGFKVEKRLGDGWMVISINNNKYLYRYREAREASTEVLAPYHE